VPIFSGFLVLACKYVVYGEESKWLPRSFRVEGKQTVSGAFLPHYGLYFLNVALTKKPDLRLKKAMP